MLEEVVGAALMGAIFAGAISLRNYLRYPTASRDEMIPYFEVDDSYHDDVFIYQDKRYRLDRYTETQTTLFNDYKSTKKLHSLLKKASNRAQSKDEDAILYQLDKDILTAIIRQREGLIQK